MQNNKTDMAGISITICTMNSSRTIDECLKALLSSIEHLKKKKSIVCQFVIVDGGSSDNTIDLVDKKLSKYDCEVYVRPELSLSESRSFSFEQANYPIILQLDSDVILYRDALVKVFNEFEHSSDKDAVLEFGVKDIYYNLIPDPSHHNPDKHQKRGFFFANLIKKPLYKVPTLNLRHMEEEYARRILKSEGKGWLKTSIIVGEHHSSPDRYGGFGLSTVQRTRAFPKWCYFDEGRVDASTKHKVSLRRLLGIIYRSLNIELFLVWIKSVSNPISAIANYLKGRRSDY